MDKPPYKVPSMREIEAVPHNGFDLVSTFVGCGGSCLGFRMAGFRTIWANEFIPAARETYSANHHGSILDGRDIRQVKPEEILEVTGRRRGEIHVLNGSPPCASFSTAGRREKGWGKQKKYSDTTQRTDDLFYEFVRLLKGIQPWTFVAENVKGLVSGRAVGYFKRIMAALDGAGYAVSARVLDAKWLGVPQSRQRVIMVGVRKDFADRGIKSCHPAPFGHWYSLEEACPWIAGVLVGNPGHSMQPTSSFPRGLIKTAKEPSPIVMASPDSFYGCNSWMVPNGHELLEGVRPGADRVKADKEAAIRCIEAAQKLEGFDYDSFGLGPDHDLEESKIQPHLAVYREALLLKEGEKSQRYFQLERSKSKAPAPCVCASHGAPGVASAIHPTEMRKFTIAEVKRICSFPDDFVLTGTREQKWERLGRSVPPLMMRAIASTLRDDVLARIEELG